LVRRSQGVDEFEVRGVADRLVPYGVSGQEPVDHDEETEDELVERAVTLLRFMPRNQPRETMEDLVSPNDPQKGRRAVDALIQAALATVDAQGRLQRIA
jgi:hypothetical protein